MEWFTQKISIELLSDKHSGILGLNELSPAVSTARPIVDNRIENL